MPRVHLMVATTRNES